MAKYRKKPVVIEAVQYNGVNANLIESFMGDKMASLGRICKEGTAEVEALKIGTLEGEMRADIGDWIIKGVNGEFYPCKDDIFKKTYDAVQE